VEKQVANIFGKLGLHAKGTPRQLWIVGGIGVTPFLSWRARQYYAHSPAGTERSWLDNCPQRSLQMPELRFPERCPPSLDGLARRVLCGASACVSALGQGKERCARVERMRLAGNVPAFFELVHELGGRLLGHPQVLGDIGDRRVAQADPCERKAVRGADIPESAARHPFLHGIDELR
jgi:hypothetical protein